MAFGIFLLYNEDANDDADFTLASHVGSQETQQALCVEPIGFGASMVNLGQRQKTPGLIGITRSPRQTVRRVSRNVKYWRSPSTALSWAGAAMQEAAKGFRRLKA